MTYDAGGRVVRGLDPESRTLETLELAYDALWSSPSVAAEGVTVLFLAGSATIPNELVRLDASTGSTETLWQSSRVPVDPSHFSVPRAIEFPTEDGLTAHALFYSVRARRTSAPVDQRPPLIVMSHGGPTSNATPIFNLERQFWTSRGFAVVDVNYGGSTDTDARTVSASTNSGAWSTSRTASTLRGTSCPREKPMASAC